MPFNPIEEVKVALKCQGFYPAVKVSWELLPTPAVVPSHAEEDSENHIDEHDEIDGDLDDSDSDEEMIITEELPVGEFDQDEELENNEY